MFKAAILDSIGGWLLNSAIFSRYVEWIVGLFPVELPGGRNRVFPRGAETYALVKSYEYQQDIHPEQYRELGMKFNLLFVLSGLFRAVPPLWDIAAVCNLLEHKWVFLTLKKEHNQLPPHFRLPFSLWLQRFLGQRVRA